MEEHADARGEVGVWQHETAVEEEPEWLAIYNRGTLHQFVDTFGQDATADELNDWPRDDLIDLIFNLAGY